LGWEGGGLFERMPGLPEERAAASDFIMTAMIDCIGNRCARDSAQALIEESSKTARDSPVTAARRDQRRSSAGPVRTTAAVSRHDSDQRGPPRPGPPCVQVSEVDQARSRSPEYLPGASRSRRGTRTGCPGRAAAVCLDLRRTECSSMGPYQPGAAMPFEVTGQYGPSRFSDGRPACSYNAQPGSEPGRRRRPIRAGRPRVRRWTGVAGGRPRCARRRASAEMRRWDRPRRTSSAARSGRAAARAGARSKSCPLTQNRRRRARPTRGSLRLTPGGGVRDGALAGRGALGPEPGGPGARLRRLVERARAIRLGCVLTAESVSNLCTPARRRPS
jgi:hypothetical protein